MHSSQKFYVTSIPCVMVCNRGGKLITRDGRKAVEEQYQEEQEDASKSPGRLARKVLERWDQEDWKTL